jgi:hypothetical protein
VTWLIVLLVALVGGFMLLDGVRALVGGDYTTPREGIHAGELGPWAKLVSAVGIPPRSTGMKVAFVVYGLAYLTAVVLFALGIVPAIVLVAVAALGLWYLPFGTLLNAIVIVLVLIG